ncbi:MAG: hypothetical protein IPJ88_06475 [Myxococcales bacterium]|nr:MAG: hypothetical protein IPJ88_06475 [Myxococcales bacterium]
MFPSSSYCEGLTVEDPLQKRLAQQAFEAGGALLFSAVLAETIEYVRTEVREKPSQYSTCAQRVRLFAPGTNVFRFDGLTDMIAATNSPIPLVVRQGLQEASGYGEAMAMMLLACKDKAPALPPMLGPSFTAVWPNRFVLAVVLNVSDPGVVSPDPIMGHAISNLTVKVLRPGKEPSVVSPGHGANHPYMAWGAAAGESILGGDDATFITEGFTRRFTNSIAFSENMTGGAFQSLLFYPPYAMNHYMLEPVFNTQPGSTALVYGFQTGPLSVN